MKTTARVLLAGMPALLALTAWTSVVVAQEGAVEANRACYDCHTDGDNSMEFADGAEVSIGLDKRAFLASAHGKLACVACHVGLDPVEHAFADRGTLADYRRTLGERCASCHAGTATDIDSALRPLATITGHLHPPAADGSPLCADCHAPHAVARGPELRTAASRSCADCHEDVYATYAASVHGGALAATGNADLPACVDCHAGHAETGRTLARQNVRLGRPCMSCHGDTGLMERYGLSTNVVSTFLNDFHGVSARFYGEEGGAGLPTLVCADCHGVHDVATMSTMPADQMKAKLLRVCRDCHPDAAESFPDAWLSHYEPSPTKAPLVFVVKLAYWIFIPFVIIGLGLQIFAHLVLLPRRKRRAGKVAPAHVRTDDERRLVTRFGRRHRIEHLLVMITFVLLLLTGLPQKFSNADWAVWATSMFGGIDMMRALHRVVGILFSGLCVLHLVVAIGGVLTKKTGMTMVPTRKDFRDAKMNLEYYVGVSDEQPKFGRYDYRQKFEYWGMIVGSLVMVVSGFVLYFPMLTADYLPGQFIPAAKAAHTYEAMMALLTIVVWHMYGAHLNPDCFPLDRSIFTGRISLARMKHEHPLEWADDKDRLEIAELPLAGRRRRKKPMWPRRHREYNGSAWVAAWPPRRNAMLRPVIAPVVGILAASAVLGFTCNALRDHDSIEIGRAYFAPAAATAPPVAGGVDGPVVADTAEAWAAADLARRAAREFTIVDAERALELFAVAESVRGRVLFIDSREDALFGNGHIPDALQIDYFNIHREIGPSLPFLRLIPWLVVYCESIDCDDGFLLCQVLRDEYGIPAERLLLYLGGMREWRKLGHPIAKGVGLR